MLTNRSELVKEILARNPGWQATYEGLAHAGIPVVLLSVLCQTCEHPHIACMVDEERDAFLSAEGNEFVRSCSNCGSSLVFSNGVLLLKK
jgi:hypothetical protein